MLGALVPDSSVPGVYFSADMTEPPRAPALCRKLLLPPRRVAAIAVLAALPLASLSGAFEAEERAAAEHADLALRVQYPKRTLYREEQQLEIVVEARSPCARAVVGGLAGYLARFEDVRAVPAPSDGQRLYDGPLRPGTPLHLYVQARPRRTGIARGNLSLDCDQRHGPRLELATLVFP